MSGASYFMLVHIWEKALETHWDAPGEIDQVERDRINKAII